MIQVQVSRQQFDGLGRRIDAWIVSKVTPGGWLKTSFNRGFSHFLNGAYTDPANPWQATVKFGQIAGKDVVRDIARFWRLLVIDLFPECPLMLDLFTVYLEWMQMVYWLAHTDESLDLTTELNEEWKDLAIGLFGKENFELMIKFHIGCHLAIWTRGRGVLPFISDEDGEALHPRHAKQLWRDNCNHWRGCEDQMAHKAERRDTLEVLLQELKRRAAVPPGAQAAGPPVAPVVPRLVAVLMGPDSGVCRLSVPAAAAFNFQLRQLPWAIALFLQLATGGDAEVQYPADMPTLTSDQLELRKGVHVLCWPSDFAAAQQGGAYLHAAFRPINGTLQPTSEPPVFVAVKQGARTWYGQLILAFAARYLLREELCFVRWLDTAKKVALRARRELTARETAGPFRIYRWSTFPGSRRTGHPAGGGPHYGVVACSSVLYRAPLVASITDELNSADPLFRLNTDMYIL